MKVLALVSGGKDSCYNMMVCVREGHQIVGLANLYPVGAEELDSYMYQSVGHDGIKYYAEAMGLPLFRRPIKGTALNLGETYEGPTTGDEVEDLYHLMKEIKQELDYDAVSVGAIFSSYQKVRVENVCERLGVTMLGYLWHRNQAQLLKEMIDNNVNAIIIKVAAMGLDPRIHLGLTIKEIYPHMVQMEEKYGLNVCGEGGEYETFTLDCPLFKKKIVIEDKEMVIHSDDPFAPVGYLKFNKLKVVDKVDNK